VFIYYAFDPKEVNMSTFDNLTDRALNAVLSVLGSAIERTCRAPFSTTQFLWDLYNDAEGEMESRSSVAEATAS
jgi:hypothetical protein